MCNSNDFTVDFKHVFVNENICTCKWEYTQAFAFTLIREWIYSQRCNFCLHEKLEIVDDSETLLSH